MKKLNLFQKFTITIIVAGLIPMLLLSSFIADSVITEYRKSLEQQYEQAANYVNASLETMLDSYNTISKICFSYRRYTDIEVWNDYYSFDKLRQILQDDGEEPERFAVVRENNMKEFLSYVSNVDAHLDGVHFIGLDGRGELLEFHYSSRSTYFKDAKMYQTLMDYGNWDRENKHLQLIPTHQTGYFSGLQKPAFTVARNYFDLRGPVGDTPYVGTIFLDVSQSRLEELFQMVEFSGKEIFYVLDTEGNCYYETTDDEQKANPAVGIKTMQWDTIRTEGGKKASPEKLVIETRPNEYGLRVVAAVNTEEAFGKLRSLQSLMYGLLFLSLICLSAGSVFFSRRLTRPIYAMMNQMSEVESGNFDIELSVGSGDEIGILSQRFNQMSQALKIYINRSYVAQIKQTEAELTALKSQIYPHFLYNTLEVIRMTALDCGEERVPRMIEALSEQIHYLIGPMQDMVTLEQEISIIRKYVYLLNCRIEGKVQFSVNVKDAEEIMVPKLILQPIIENAYVHGIKPKMGSGRIMIDMEQKDGKRILSVMDNGLGMDADGLQKIQTILTGDEPGIKNEANWQSIGLKNVHDRLRYLYGEEYGISVSSTLKIGTVVCITMPIQQDCNLQQEERMV